MGGYDGSPIGSVEIYDPDADSWTLGTAMATPRYYHTSTLTSDGKVMVAAGYTGSAKLDLVETYDPALDTWTTNTPLIDARFRAKAVLLNNGKVFIHGGYGPFGFVPFWELLD